MNDDRDRGTAPASGRGSRGALPLLAALALLSIATLVLVGVLIGRVGALEDRLEATEALVAAIEPVEVEQLRTELDSLRTAVADELATIGFRGVVPTDSSGVILERLEALDAALGRIDEMAATLDRLEGRLDQICEGVPIC